MIHGLEEPVAVGIYNGELEIEFSNILKWIENEVKDESRES